MTWVKHHIYTGLPYALGRQQHIVILLAVIPAVFSEFAGRELVRLMPMKDFPISSVG